MIFKKVDQDIPLKVTLVDDKGLKTTYHSLCHIKFKLLGDVSDEDEDEENKDERGGNEWNADGEYE